MTNFKTLKIEKEIEQEYNVRPKQELSLLLNSCYFDYPSISKREPGGEYCTVRVIDCQNSSWWYKDLIGLEFFCRIRFGAFPDKTKYVKGYYGVKLTTNKEITFNDFDPKDVVMV